MVNVKWKIVWWTYRELNPELCNANAVLYRSTIGPFILDYTSNK